METNETRKRRKDEGFTLVEILVVITILGILVAVVSPQVLGRIDQAKVTKANVDISTYAQALEQYALDVGDYPASEDGLQALISEPDGVSGWSGPYVQGQIKLDPWGNELIYAYPGEHTDLGYAFDLMSYGKDGKEGGEKTSADIANWSKDLEQQESAQR